MQSNWLFAVAVLLVPLTGFCGDSSAPVFEAIRSNDLVSLKSIPASEVERKDSKGATPLMHAAAFGSPEAMRLLLDKGAQVNAKNTFDATALLWSACDAVKARMLVERHADVNAPSKQGRTPLMVAARCDGNSAMVALLLSQGADPRPSDAQGGTALHQAANAGDVESIRLLIDKGADVNALDKSGDSALMGAAGNGSVEAVRLLLRKGARVNVARTSYGMVKNGPIALVKVTALIHAAPYGSPELIQALVDAGAEVDARDGRDMTSLMFAVASEHQNVGVVRILLRAGAAVNAKSNTGETALDWATKFGNPAVIALLTDAGARHGNARVEAPHTDLRNPREAMQAMSQSIALLQRSSAEFFRQSGCVGCHHQPATAMAVRAARKAGLKVDESAAREQGEVLRLGWGVSADDMLQGIHRGGGSDRIVNQLLGVSAAGDQQDALTDAAVADIAAMQHPDGHWFDEHQARSPIADGLIARARTFLAGATAVTGDDRAMLVRGLSWAEAPAARRCLPSAESIPRRLLVCTQPCHQISAVLSERLSI